MELLAVSSRDKSNVYYYEIDSHFESDYKFNLDKHVQNKTEHRSDFQIAFGLTSYDSVYENIEDPNYATLKAK